MKLLALAMPFDHRFGLEGLRRC